MKIPLLAVIFSTAIAASSQAALLTNFSDNFNRADGPLGSNYTLGRGPAWTIVSNIATLTDGSDSYTYVNVGTLPTTLDYGSGIGFTAKVDFFIGPTSSSNAPGMELLFNYQDVDNFSGLRYRGDGINRIYASQRNGGSQGLQSITSDLTSSLTFNDWYTLQVTSNAAGNYVWSFTNRTTTALIASGTYIPANIGYATFTGGYLALGADSGGVEQMDNLSGSVVPEPSTVGMLLFVGGIGIAARRWRKRG